MSKIQRLMAIPKRVLLSPFIKARDQRCYPYSLSIVAIVKNEANYIKEWIEYHRYIGIQHFYLYNNGSTDNTRSILENYSNIGLCDLIEFPGKGRQLNAYNHAISHYKYETKWMAFIDADEFIYCSRENCDIATVLDDIAKGNSRAAGIAVNWRMFGSSGLTRRPMRGGVLQNFKYYGKPGRPGNNCIKTIANPRLIAAYAQVHYSTYYFGYYSVDENGHRVSGWANQDEPTDILRICHYFTKSKEEWIERRSAGKADKCLMLDNRTMEEFKKHDNNDLEDLRMQAIGKVISDRI